MKHTDIGILLINSFRALAYLQKMTLSDNLPSSAILLEDGKENWLDDVNAMRRTNLFLPFEPFEVTCKKYSIPFNVVNAKSINDSAIIRAVRDAQERYIIFTGGGILKEDVLSQGKLFIHMHPGRVPEFRGSTCIYYSLLAEDVCSVTSFLMAADLDKGDVLAIRSFSAPKHIHIDYDYDAYIRAETLISVLEGYANKGKFIQQPQPKRGETYFIIHPLLKHLALLRIENNLPPK